MTSLVACQAHDDEAELREVGVRAARMSAIRVDVPTGMTDDDIADATLRHVRAAGFALTSNDGLRERKRIVNEDLQHVRLDQFHRGVPVFGADVVAHTRGEELVLVSGNLVANLDVETTPSIAAATAVARARAHTGATAGTATRGETLAAAPDPATLVIADSEGGARLAWHVVLSAPERRGPPWRWNYLVDAHEGRILADWNGIHTAKQAGGPGGNEKVSRSWEYRLDTTHTASGFVMDTDDVATYDRRAWYWYPIYGVCNYFDDTAANDAHGFAEVNLDMLYQWFGFDSIDGNGQKLVSFVHDGPYDNASWNPGSETMEFGDGDLKYYPLSGGLDVVAHEVHHGFTQHHSNLFYDDSESGGMNESFSDIAGVAAEFFHGTPTAESFLHGEEVYRAEGGSRNLCNPTADGNSIAHYSDFYPSLDVHYSSGIMNRAFCLSARLFSGGTVESVPTAAGVRRAARAYYTANANYWTALSDFEQGCQGVLDAAQELHFSDTEIGMLQDAWSAVGVDCTAPSESPGATTSGGSTGEDFVGGTLECTTTFTTSGP